MLRLAKIFLLISSVKELVAEGSDLLVDTPLGRVAGFYKTSSYGHRYRAFEGIPYGKPPVGNLRFEPPQGYGPWKGTLSATKPPTKCLQSPPIRNSPATVEGSEDCLYLNIYTPSNNSKKRSSYPVLFWIHGGSFLVGDGHGQGSSYIMNRDVVFVNINYRLNILGFLSTEDEVVPGNMGLKDQNLALRWVHENIEHFGGDPNRITLGGFSAGGASVHYHYLSPMSRGLFRGGMSFSGNALDHWAQTEGSAEKAKTVASLLECPTDSTKDMVKCLKSKPAESIPPLVTRFQPWVFTPAVPFGPVVEKNSAKPFIDRSPMEIIASGDAADLPWMSSIASEEGLFLYLEFVENETLMAELDAKWETIAPHLLDFNYTIPQSKHAQVAAVIRRHYSGENRLETATSRPLIKMSGDRSFSPMGARVMAKANMCPVWFYYYSYRGEISLADLANVTRDYGVAHGDDLILFIRDPRLRPITDRRTLDMQKNLLDMIESFMQNREPTVGVHWPRVDPSNKNLQYLHISGPDKLTAESSSNVANEKFWASIHFKENEFIMIFDTSPDHQFVLLP